MRKQFYIEPEIEIHVFNLSSDVRTVDGDLDISTNPDEGGDFDYGDIY